MPNAETQKEYIPFNEGLNNLEIALKKKGIKTTTLLLENMFFLFLFKNKKNKIMDLSAPFIPVILDLYILENNIFEKSKLYIRILTKHYYEEELKHYYEEELSNTFKKDLLSIDLDNFYIKADKLNRFIKNTDHLVF